MDFTKAIAYLPGVILSVLAFGCSDPSREARQFSEKYPVTAEVTQLFEAMKTLAKDSPAREALEREHTTWAANRVAHCLAMSKLQGTANDASKKAVEDITTCFVGVDKQRAEALRAGKLVVLLEQPPVTPVKGLAVRLSIPFEQGQFPGDLKVSPDGGLVVVGKGGGDIDIFDTRTAQMVRTIRTGKYSYIAHMQFSANGRVLFLSSSQHRGMKIYDPYTGDLLRDYDGCMGSFVLLPGGRHVLHADGPNLRLYDVVANRTLETPYAQRAHVSRIALSPDGKRAAVESSDRHVTLWEIVSSSSGVTLSKGAEAIPDNVRFSLSIMEFSRAGDVLLTATHEGTLTRWSLPDLRRIQVSQIGPSYASELLRLPETNQIVVPGMRDGQISHLLFWDFDRDVAATMPLTQFGNSVQLAWSKYAPFLYVASVAGLSVADFPDEKMYRVSASVLDPLLDASGRTREAVATRMPMLRNIASDAGVEAIGVYEGRAPPGPVTYGVQARRKSLPVNLFVGKTDRPSILVLSSYEPIEWRITQTPDARIKHILLAGYHDSVVVTKPGVEITKIGGSYAYELNSPGYGALDNAVRQYLGKGIDRFQGAYSGNEFYIGLTSAGTRPRSDRGMYQCADATGRISAGDRPCDEPGFPRRGAVTSPPSSGGSATIGTSPGPTITISPGPTPHQRIIQCGRTTIVCDASDKVMCGGKQVICR